MRDYDCSNPLFLPHSTNKENTKEILSKFPLNSKKWWKCALMDENGQTSEVLTRKLCFGQNFAKGMNMLNSFSTNK